jgi:protein phosphatase
VIKPQAAVWSDIGQKRDRNEDRVFYQVLESSDVDPIALCIVADGMGGHLGGHVASQWVVETLKRELADLFLPTDPRLTLQLGGVELSSLSLEANGEVRPSDAIMTHKLRRAVEQANRNLYEYALRQPDQARGAGSTVTLALVRGKRAYVANVGDSRTYLLRRGQLTQLTRDHSVVAELVAAGRLAADDAFSHPQAGLITRCLGCIDRIEVDIELCELESGDCLLLCCDGLWSMLRDPGQIAHIVDAAPSLEAAARNLVDAANGAGGSDNISVALLRVVERPDIPG